MKSPDEIEKGLECCAASYADCHRKCPYKPDCDGSQILKDALALIQQLEEEREAAVARSDRLTEHIWELEKDIYRLTDEACNAYNIQTEQLARIQQLEKRVIHLEALNQSNLTTITMQERTRARLQEQISQLEAERDAAAGVIEHSCATCKHYYYNSTDGNDCIYDGLVGEDGCHNGNTRWEWCGVPKEVRE